MARLARWSVNAVCVLLLFVLAVIAAGGAVSAAEGRPKLRGELVALPDGRRLHLVCRGERQAGMPLVVFESGAFGFSADWGVVQQRLADRGIASCAYDRAGMGRSDPGPAPRDGQAITADLHALLAASGKAPSFVLVGHSMAGLFVRLYAARYPEQVAGAVLVDASTPEVIDNPQAIRFVNGFAQASRAAGWGASIGLFKVLQPMGDRIGLTGDAKAEKKHMFASGRHNRTAAAEVGQWERTSRQALAAGELDPALPVAVVTAGPGRISGWKEAQAAPARRSRHGYVENDVTASHASLLGVNHADAIVRGITHVLAAAKGAAPVTPAPPAVAPQGRPAA